MNQEQFINLFGKVATPAKAKEATIIPSKLWTKEFIFMAIENSEKSKLELLQERFGDDVVVAPIYYKIRKIKDNGDNTYTVLCYRDKSTMYIWQEDLVKQFDLPNDARRWFEKNIDKIQITLPASEQVNPKTGKPYAAKPSFGFWDTQYEEIISVDNVTAEYCKASKKSGKPMWILTFEYNQSVVLAQSAIDTIGGLEAKGFIGYTCKIKGKNKLVIKDYDKYESTGNTSGIEEEEDEVLA